MDLYPELEALAMICIPVLFSFNYMSAPHNAVRQEVSNV